MTETERLAQEARQRIVEGIVDAWGRHRPDGPRKVLTAAQRRAYEQALEDQHAASFHMERSMTRR